MTFQELKAGDVFSYNGGWGNCEFLKLNNHPTENCVNITSGYKVATVDKIEEVEYMGVFGVWKG